MSMTESTIAAFCANTASKAPTPGGGSVAALVGALGCALAEMVAQLTAGKKAYADAAPEMERILKEGEALRGELLSLIDADCAAFGGYMRALALPKETDAEKTVRREALREAAASAANAPLRMARASARVLPLCETAVRCGNRGAVTDAMMAAMLSRAAVRSAVLNVRINLPSLGDKAAAAALEAECAALEAEALRREEEILALAAL